MPEFFESGHRVEKIEGKDLEKLKRCFVYDHGAIRLEPGGWIYPQSFAKYANHIYNFKVKPTDVFVLGIPKSGTNWVQEIVWNLIHNPYMDNPEAEVCLDARYTQIELDHVFNIPGGPSIDPHGELVKTFNKFFPEKHYTDGLFIHLAALASDPRLIKNHIPCCQLPQDMFKISKVIYITRDVRDVIVSYYYFSKLHKMAKYKGTLEDLVDDFINSTFLPYWDHVREAWEKRNDPNFLFLFYEDLKADPTSEIKRIDTFLGTNRTNKQIDNVVDYTSFSKMKEKAKDYNQPTSLGCDLLSKDAQKKGASFFRKGKVGTWKEEFSKETEEKVNLWIRKNLSYFDDEFKIKIKV